MKRSLLALLLLLPLAVLSQYQIRGTITGLQGKKLTLLSIFGERTRAIDSVRADSSGAFSFTLKGRLHGMYRVGIDKERWVDLIWNREDVVFKTTAGAPSDSLVILQSEENLFYRAFADLDRLNQAKLQVLAPVLDYYPVKDAFYQKAAQEFEYIQQTQRRFLDSAANVHPGSFGTRMARVMQGPYIPSALSMDERIDFLKKNFFAQVDFSDTALLRSMVFPNKTIAYLSLYSNNRLSQKQLEAEFIKAVNVILGAASVNPDLFRFLLDYLVGGFDKFHFDEVITYIADNFQDPSSCEDQARKSDLQKKLENFQKLSIGKTAPPLIVPDVKGKPADLHAINSEYTLLVFWSTNCPHCLSMIPRLKEFYTSQQPKRFEVMAVSIDTSKTAWTSYLREEKLNWINASELKGFYCTSCDDYNIYATPTMFLLDREKKILSKPISLMELEQALRDHQLLR